MNISTHLCNFISAHLNCTTVFTLTGGGAMFLNDAFGNHKKLRSIYCHHEQAAAMAAVGYAKLNNLGVCITTSGCGSTNSLTGLLDAWQDNVPVIFISGQVKLQETSYLAPAKLRTFGVQEFNIIPVVESFTKAAYFIKDLDEYYLAIRNIKSDLFDGRPGPVWLDIPMDIQSKVLTHEEIQKIDSIINFNDNCKPMTIPENHLDIIKSYISESLKPVILVGNGLRLSQNGEGISLLEDLANLYSIPIVSTYLGADFFRIDSNFYFGTIGLKSSRIANLIVNNSDLLLTIGTRLATSTIGFEYKEFAKSAKKIIVDIDPEEHKKGTINYNLFIESDAKEFLKILPNCFQKTNYKNWLSKCQIASTKLPIQEVFSTDDFISIYDTVRLISTYSNDFDILVSDAGSSYYVSSIMFAKMKYQRYITSGAQADMGFALPAAIGCSFATDSCHRIHAITGDGSLQLNIQELQTLKTYRRNLTLYVLNNNGYLSIRSTQNRFFHGRQCGTDSSNGVEFPELSKIADAYGIQYFKFNKINSFISFLKNNKDYIGPQIVEILCPDDEEIIPRVFAEKDENGNIKSAPLTKMYPPLDNKIYEELTALGFQI